MAKSVVVRMECDRCHTVWYEDYVQNQSLPVAASLKLTLTHATPGDAVSRDVVFESLCSACSQTVSNYIDGIDKSKAKKEDGDKKDSPPAEAPKDPQPAVKSKKSSSAGALPDPSRGPSSQA